MLDFNGLNFDEVSENQKKFGKNELVKTKKQNLFVKIFHIICEPMFLLLIVAAIIYFILGEPIDGAIMLVFVLAIITIDIVQELKTDKTLNALKDLSAPHVKVIRNGEIKLIISTDLVPNDIMILEEGVKVPADGYVLKANDLCIDESSLTGESVGVWKCEQGKDKTNDYFKKDYVYAGTMVTQGSAYIKVQKTGANTEYGKISKNLAMAPVEKSPLQKQTGKLVTTCAGIAGVLFALVGIITYFNLAEYAIKDRVISSILSGITLAMAMIPEEFPVILTIFLSMGAWRLAKKQSLVRKLPSVETLGAVSVLCVDKTGTLTMNQMAVNQVLLVNGNEKDLLETMGKACETEAYDPMEKAMIKYCEDQNLTKDKLFNGELVYEYSFTNELKMMGHVWKENDKITICAKGSAESILSICKLSNQELLEVNNKVNELSKEGLRVIAVASANVENVNNIPKSIINCKLTLCGLIGLMDPPRPNIDKYIKECVNAHIKVVMITGDNGITAASIAKKIGIPNCDTIITGDQIEKFSDKELQECVKNACIFSRVIPAHKMRIVKAFKDNGEIVAMTGDGVNDAPALKHANIGIAMGKRGSEVTKESADLILLDDNFSTIVETIKDGRRIYNNIKKAIGYVFTIHIPIALTAIIAPLLQIAPSNLMLMPLHIVLLELIIDPTCSIVLERIPAENNIMNERPRNTKESILKGGVLTKGVLQGLIIFLASFGAYYMLKPQTNANLARSMALSIITLSNLWLVIVNSSTKEFAFQSIKKLCKDKVMWIVAVITMLMLIIILYTPLNSFLKLAPLNFVQFIIAFGISLVAVLWFEFIKLFKYFKKDKSSNN